MRILLGVQVALLVACVPHYEAYPPPQRDDAGAAPSAPSADSGAVSDGSACLTRCEGDTLVACDDSQAACALGCSDGASGGACKLFDPEGPVRPADLRTSPGTGDLVLGSDTDVVVLDTNTGSLTRRASPDAGADSGAGVVLRAPNVDPAVEEVAGGYAFRVEGDRAILRAVTITLGEHLRFEGALPLSLVAAQTVRVDAAVRVPCGQLGGGHPGDATPQTGTSAAADQGAAGGANASGGGNGYGVPGPPSRPRVGDALLGGGAGGTGSNTTGTAGGDGGGSLQLVAAQSIRLGRGVGDKKGINVSGCGGRVSDTLASGGGAGGTLVLEAPTLSALNDGSLVSNGGGGAGFGPGEDGRFDGEAAQGGGYLDGVASGNGGTRTSPRGGDHGGRSTLGNGYYQYSGGGGGVGFVVLKTANGVVDFAAAAVVSPEPMIGVLTAAAP